jgi:predicted RNA binding protein YcfA (HicA-like mRNA interferase family)
VAWRSRNRPPGGRGLRDRCLKSISGREFWKVLQKAGWRLLRVNGSHHIFGKDGYRERITVPVHGSDTLKPGLLSHFMKQAGLSERDL